MKAKSIKTALYALFMEQLSEYAKKNSAGVILLTLFGLRGEDNLQEELEYLFNLSRGKDEYFKASGKKDWFFIWHKSIRQVGLFSDIYTTATVELVTAKERSEWKFLINKFRIEKAEKRSTVKGELFVPDYKRYLELDSKIRREDKERPINGSMDVILWNMIHVGDSGEQLERVFERTFQEYEYLLTDKKKLVKQ